MWPIAVAALAAIAAIGGAGWYLLGQSSAAIQQSVLTRLTFDTGMTQQPALSPDGTLVAYMSDRATKLPNIWVQQVNGGQAVKLTDHEGGAVGPTFSPDGTRIAYTTVGKEPGVYVVATIGGEPRKIVSDGFVPKFSPDGSLLSFVALDGSYARLMIVPAAGGQPRSVAGNFAVAGASVWSPDSSHVLVAGRVDTKGPAVETVDWFAVAVKDGTAVRTGASALLRSQKVLSSTAVMTGPEDWNGGAVLFSASTGDAVNIWRIAVNATTFQAEGLAERVTSGTTQEISPTTSRDGTLAFAAADTNENYWALPIDANAVSVTGPRTQIMNNSASDRHALSLDGNRLFYCSHRGGQTEIRSRDLRTGKEALLLSATTLNHVTAASADGSLFVFNVPAPTQTRYLGSASGGPPRLICDNCGHTALSPDGSRLAYIAGEEDHQTYHVLDIASGQSRAFLSTTTKTKPLDLAEFSPDGQWAAIATLGFEELFLVPVREAPVGEKEMIPMGRPLRNGYQMARFSPDGNTIYYVSVEDGHSCIYAQRLSASRHPEGAPVVVQHLHEANTFGHPHGMRVGADKIVLLMNQGSSNIWLMQPRR
jgi:Tol biopolymer transport system component